MDNIVKDLFLGRKLIIATKHEKEKIMKPLLEAALGVEVIVPIDLDTDLLGTFSGEIERPVDPLETARMKCRMACEQYQCSLAIASEGSFGPHPTLHFVPGDDEIVLMMDLENNLEFKARSLSTTTNFNGALLTNWHEVKEFALKVSFPSHGLILRNKKDGIDGLIKGIRTWEELEQNVGMFISSYGQVFLETDMRAMHNPTRMKVIEEATQKLIEIIKHTCPNCNTPGLEIVELKYGLPCSHCGLPTRSVMAYIYGCQKCNFKKEELYPKGKITEVPMYCDWCNP